jgi:DNA-binding transcriptional LysR family regulator
MSGTIEIGAVEIFVRVAELESALGTRLLHRTTRHGELTSAGKTFLRACDPALGTIMEAGRALAGSLGDGLRGARFEAPDGHCGERDY